VQKVQSTQTDTLCIINWKNETIFSFPLLLTHIISFILVDPIYNRIRKSLAKRKFKYREL